MGHLYYCAETMGGLSYQEVCEQNPNVSITYVQTAGQPKLDDKVSDKKFNEFEAQQKRQQQLAYKRMGIELNKPERKPGILKRLGLWKKRK